MPPPQPRMPMPKTDTAAPWRALLESDNLPQDLERFYDAPFLERIAKLALARTFTDLDLEDICPIFS